jgi:hypothetical protein
MPTYNSGAVSDTAIGFQKPITLQQGRGLRDNPLAIAEGATGAPPVHPAALDVYRGRVDVVGNTPQQYLNLDRVNNVRLDVGILAVASVATQTLEASYSANNGSTWGAYQAFTNVFATGAAAQADRRHFAGVVRVSLVGGAWNANGNRAGDPAAPSVGATIVSNGTHTVPIGCNAVRFRLSSASGNATIDLDAMSGVRS